MAAENNPQTVPEQSAPEPQRSRTVHPPAEIIDGPDAIRVFVDMPGVDDLSADISLDRNVLTIRGTGRDAMAEGCELVHAEYAVGNYERAFTISDEIDRNGIDAVVANGVLELTLPKAKESASRKIEIRSA